MFQGRAEYYWRGFRGNIVMMEGEAWRTTEGRWFYGEKLLRNGRQEYSMLSACHISEGD